MEGIPTATWYTTLNDSRSKTVDCFGGAFLEQSVSSSPKFSHFSRAYFNSFHYDGLYPLVPESPDNPDYLNERRAGVEMQGNWNPLTYERLVFGAEYTNKYMNDYWSGTSDVVIGDEKHTYSDVSVFAQNEYQFNTNAILTTGLRQTWYSLGWKATVPRAALVFLPTRLSSLRLLYGEEFRAPAITEAYYWYPEQSKANPELRPERIRTFEVSAEYRLVSALHGSVSLYDYEVGALINATLDEFDWLTVYRNIGKAEGQGAELELAYRSVHGVSGYTSWVYQIASEETGYEVLSNSPRNIFRAGVTLPILEAVRASLELQTDAQIHVVSNEDRRFHIVYFALSTRQKFGSLQGTVYVHNVFNTYYEHPES